MSFFNGFADVDYLKMALHWLVYQLSHLLGGSQDNKWADETFTFPLIGKSPYLMFTNRHEIRRIDLVKKDYTQVVPTLKNAVALDVDVTTNKMYWCDLYHRKIFRYTQH